MIFEVYFIGNSEEDFMKNQNFKDNLFKLTKIFKHLTSSNMAFELEIQKVNKII